MKKILLFLFALQALMISAQDSTSHKARYFYIGENYSQDYCSRVKVKPHFNTLSEEEQKQQKSYENSLISPKLGYTTGINFGFCLNEHISFESGIFYSNKGYKMLPSETYYDLYAPPVMTKHTINYGFFEFPLKAYYSFFKSKFSINIGVGASLSFCRSASMKSVPLSPTPGLKSQETWVAYPKELSCFPMVSIGANYQINDRLKIKVEPNFRYGLPSIDDSFYYLTRLWSAGINIGFNFAFL